jgi:hypothetical protein
MRLQAVLVKDPLDAAVVEAAQCAFTLTACVPAQKRRTEIQARFVKNDEQHDKRQRAQAPHKERITI